LATQQKIDKLCNRNRMHSSMPGRNSIWNLTQKKLSKLINDHSWQEKENAREQGKLDKMIKRRQFTTIERAYTTTNTDAADPNHVNVRCSRNQ